MRSSALQSFQVRCSTPDVGHPASSSRNWRLVQSPQPTEVSLYALNDPTMPLAVPSALWSSLSRVCRSRFQLPGKNLSANSAFLQSFTHLTLAGQPQSAGSSPGLLLPSAQIGIEGPPFRGFCLPATFRLQGLATLVAACSLRSPAGFVSHRQRSWDSPFGASPPDRYPAVSDRKYPPTVSLPLFPSPTSRGQAGPSDLGFWALSLPGVSDDSRWV
jgi:hypothetical protein